MPSQDLDRHLEIDEPRLQQRQREFVFCVDPTVVAAGMVVALMKFQKRPSGGAKFGAQIGVAEEPMRFGAGIVLTFPAIPPVAFSYGLVVVLRTNAVKRVNPVNLFLGFVRNAVVNEELAPTWRWRQLHRPPAERERVAIFRFSAAVIPVQGLSNLFGRRQQGLARPANERARIADECRRQQTSRAD